MCSFARRRISVWFNTFGYFSSYGETGDRFMPWFTSSGGCQQPSDLTPTIANWFHCPTFRKKRESSPIIRHYQESTYFPGTTGKLQVTAQGLEHGHMAFFAAEKLGKPVYIFQHVPWKMAREKGRGMAVGEQIQPYLPRTFNEQNPIYLPSKYARTAMPLFYHKHF